MPFLYLWCTSFLYCASFSHFCQRSSFLYLLTPPASDPFGETLRRDLFREAYGPPPPLTFTVESFLGPHLRLSTPPPPALLRSRRRDSEEERRTRRRRGRGEVGRWGRARAGVPLGLGWAWGWVAGEGLTSTAREGWAFLWWVHRPSFVRESRFLLSLSLGVSALQPYGSGPEKVGGGRTFYADADLPPTPPTQGDMDEPSARRSRGSSRFPEGVRR